ncbi:MAG: PEP-utilizing enzyme [Candidatus Micrarchaeota archaeon]
MVYLMEGIKWFKLVSRPATGFVDYAYHSGLGKAQETLGKDFPINGMKTDSYGDVTDWYLDFDEVSKLTEVVKAKQKKNPKFLRDLADTVYNYSTALLVESKKIKLKRLNKVSDDEILLDFRKFVRALESFAPMLIIPFPVEKYLTSDLKMKIKKECGITDEKTEEFFKDMAVLEKDSDVYLDRKDLFEMAVIKKQRKSIDKRIKDHLEKYGWMACHQIMYSKRWSKNHILSEISKIADPVTDLKKLKKSRKEEILKSRKLLAGMPKGIREEAELMRQYMFLRSYRMDCARKAVYNAKTLFGEISRRTDLSVKELNWLFPQEIEQLLLTGEKPDFKLRMKSIRILRQNGMVTYETGITEQTEETSVKKVTGKIAQLKPPVIGTAKVVFNADDVSKINKGDIMIAPMTTPQMTMAMMKAAAIVTDEGGILCHAAIVSREFGIPCVIGTGNATKVFKDGDRVRVDATTGIVEKIS